MNKEAVEWQGIDQGRYDLLHKKNHLLYVLCERQGRSAKGIKMANRHQRYKPIDRELSDKIARSVLRDGMTYTKASEQYGVSRGAISKIIKEVSRGERHQQKRRGRRVDEASSVAYAVIIELAKMSCFTPWILARVCTAISRRKSRMGALRTQISRLLEKNSLTDHCVNKWAPGVVAFHMIKVCWNENEMLGRGYMLMAMDLGTGKLHTTVHTRITPRRILACIDDLIDKEQIECREVNFSSNEEVGRYGDAVVSATLRIEVERFRNFLEGRLIETVKDQIKIVAGKPVKRNPQWIRINGIQDDPAALLNPVRSWLERYATD